MQSRSRPCSPSWPRPARRQAARDGIAPDTADFAYLADLRYVGQEHTIAIPVRDPALLSGDFAPLRAAFDAEHDQRYGQAAPDERLEIVNVRLVVTAARQRHAGGALAVGEMDAGAAGRRPMARGDLHRSGEAAENPHRLAAVACRRRARRRPGGDRGAERHHAHPSRRRRDRVRRRPSHHRRGADMTRNEAHPITVEVVRNAIVAYADEMANALSKAAYNMMIYEVRDYCCGLIDTQARMISQNRGGLPIFLADLGVAVADGIERYGLERLRARRRDRDEPGRDLRPAPQQRRGLFAVLPQRRAGRLRRQPRALGRHRRRAAGLRLLRLERHLCRRHPDALAEDLRGRQAQRDAVADHPRQHALSGLRRSATCARRSPPASSARGAMAN